jgi:prephenate dehydrogenase
VTDREVAVIGLGLIGGSLAGALRRAGAHVLGYDLSCERAQTAFALGLVDGVSDHPADAVRAADMVLLAVPVRSIVELLPEIDAVTPPGSVILDTGSVKGPVVDAMGRLPGAARAVGGHPLAGDQRSGPEVADPDLFEGRPFVLCASSETSDEAMSVAENLVREVRGIPLRTTANEHDRVLARTSHLPQFLSTALALCVRPDDGKLSGPALRDMTRLAESDSTMWRDIAGANRDALVESMREFERQFGALVTAVETSDLTALVEAMESGSARAQSLAAGTDT